jgi:hypothetical protein
MTAPLTAEVAQMVTRLRGQDAIPNRNEVADMITTLATQLAERDAECREAVMQSLASMGQAQEAHEAQVQAQARIAALTEAAAAMETICRDVEQWWIGGAMQHFIGAPFCMFALRAALTTDKEPKT